MSDHKVVPTSDGHLGYADTLTICSTNIEAWWLKNSFKCEGAMCGLIMSKVLWILQTQLISA